MYMENPTAITPATNPVRMYRIPMSLWFVEQNQRVKKPTS